MQVAVSFERPPLYKSLTRTSSSSSGSKCPPFCSNDSSSILVGSAYERKINDVEPIKERIDADKLEQIRKLMAKDKIDYW
jgi:Xaa-Pro aminopeptidase